MYPYSLNHLLSLEHRSIKISLKKLIRVTKNYIPDMMLNIYKDDPLLVDHVEKHLDNFSKNDEVEWDKLKMLWCNPGIFKRSVDVSILTEDSLLNKSDSDVDLLRNELYSMRTQLKSYLSKKEINRHRQSSISTDGRPSVTIDSLDDENILSRQSSIDETEGIVEQIREDTSEGTCEDTYEDTLTRTNLNDAQDEEITKLKILRDAQSSEISALKNIIDSQATKIASLSSTIDEQAHHSNTLSNTVIGQANKIEALTRVNVEQANMLASLSSTVNEQSDMIKSLTSSNDSQHIQILSMKDKIDTQDASITALNSIHNKQIEDLRRYNDAMNAHVIEIELLRSEKEFQLNEISTLRRTIIYQEQRFNETVDSINSIASNLDDEDMPLFSCW
jgi:chromosome segregation ATPase